MGDLSKDGRFSHIASDPRFKTIPRSQRQVKIDKRFQGMFKDKRFKMNYTVDKRGKPISRTSNEDLERYYALSSSSESEDANDDDDDGIDDESHPSREEQKLASKSKQAEESESGSTDEDEGTSGSEAESERNTDEDGNAPESVKEKLSAKIKSKLHDISVDYARGEGTIVSDSSSDEESSDEDNDFAVEHGWGELDKDAERTDEVTNRLALCNMDWDRIRAVDIMVLLNSFTPPGGLIRSVTIYPSEFGLERLKKEEEQGPSELVEGSSKVKPKGGGNEGHDEEEDDDSSDEKRPEDENEEGSKYHIEKLRQYQLNRLKYFYAIVECDSSNTANHIYTECDGMEYESSSTRLDLRFVPDDTTFEHPSKDICTAMPDAGKYRPRTFTTTALQQAKVDLTWDETDPSRIEITNRIMAGDNVDDSDLQAYLASSSGEEEEEVSKKKKKKEKKNGVNGTSQHEDNSDELSGEDEEGNDDPIAKYRALLSGIEEEENEKKNKGVHMEISWGLGLKEKTDEAMKKRMSKSEDLTPFQEMMEKRKQKRLEKKKLKEQKKTKSVQGDSDHEDDMYSDDDIPSDVDMNDPYFAEEFKDQKKQSKKKKGKKQHDPGETEEDLKNKAELELLLLDKEDRKHFNFKKMQEEESSNLSKRKLKAKRKKEKGLETESKDDFKVNVDDDRFAALYSSHHYNIDPTDPHFRKGQGMEALISAKHKRLAESSHESVTNCKQKPPQPKKSKQDAELSLLVKSVKNKAQKLGKK